MAEPQCAAPKRRLVFCDAAEDQEARAIATKSGWRAQNRRAQQHKIVVVVLVPPSSLFHSIGDGSV